MHITGAFNCNTQHNDTFQESFQILINNEPVTSPYFVPNSAGGQCWCSNCHTAYVIAISSRSLEHNLNRTAGANNTISLSLGSSTSPPNTSSHSTVTSQANSAEPSPVTFACLSSLTLELHFTVPELEGLRITPTSGPTSGHTNVTVYTQSEMPDLPLFCVFDETRVPASRLRASLEDTLTCRSPRSFPRIVEFSLALQVLGEYYYGASFADFQYYYEVILTDVNPYYGPTKGGTLVTVQGNFEYTDMCSCFFIAGNVTKQTPCVSTSNYKSVVCKTPPWDSESRVDLAVSLNGQQHSTKLKFYYRNKGKTKERKKKREIKKIMQMQTTSLYI